MIEFINVTKEYSDVSALKNVSFHIDDGEFVFIIGHSGAGKTTLTKLLLREEKVTEGKILVDGIDVTALPARKIPYYRRKLGMVFQDFRLFRDKTAYENIACIMRAVGTPGSEIRRRVPALLRTVAMEDKQKHFPRELSGGEQQRVALARAIANIDRWILSALNTLVKNVNSCLDDYEPTKAGRLIQDFVIDNVSNWFVRLSRKRFWGSDMSQDKLSAYQTLYTCLETVARLMAPIAPFYADRLYLDLTSVTGRADAASVHLAKFPECDELVVDTELEYRMKLAQQISSMVLALRKKEALIVRQPLQKIAIPAADEVMKARIEAVKQLILSEVNVKELVFVEGDGILVKKIKCNFRTLGKKFGKLMKSVNEAVLGMSQEQIAELEKNGNITLQVEGNDAVIEIADVEIFSEDVPGWTVANEGALTVALDVEVTEELRREGIAREIVKKIQAMRKDSGFDIVDRIAVMISSSEVSDAAVEQFNAYICNQVLADELKISNNVDGDNVVEFDNATVKLSVRKL